MKRRGEGGGGEKNFRIRYKGTCTKMSHEQTNSINKTFQTRKVYKFSYLFTEVSNTFVIVQRTNKYVLTNNHVKCFYFKDA